MAGSQDDQVEDEGGFRDLIIPTAKSVVLKLHLVSTNPLYTHAQNKAQMLKDMEFNRQKYNKGEKPPKPKPLLPFEEFLGTLYLIPGQEHPKRKLTMDESWKGEEASGKYGFPRQSLHTAILTASQAFHSGYNPAHVKSIKFLAEPIIPLVYDEVQMTVEPIPMPHRAKSEKGREEEHLGKRPVSRAKFPAWEMDLTISYKENLFTDAKQVVALFVTAGENVGLGSGRKEKNGEEIGTFRVESATMLVAKKDVK